MRDQPNRPLFGPGFPCEDHYQQLKAKGFDSRSGQDLWFWPAYDYGWRRIMLQTREDNSPIDHGRNYYDAIMAAEAEVFYARKLNRRSPDLAPASKKPPPTAEEIAHVERCVRIILDNIRVFTDASRKAFAEPRGPGTVPWRDLLESFGASAKPARWQDSATVLLDARKLGLIRYSGENGTNIEDG